MSTVTGIAGVTVAILITVDVFRLSDDVLNSKMSKVTGIAEAKVAILVTVDALRLSDDPRASSYLPTGVVASYLLGLLPALASRNWFRASVLKQEKSLPEHLA